MRRASAGAAAMALLAAGCADMPPVKDAGAAPQVTMSSLAIGNQTVLARWIEPAGPPQALMLLQHGFSRDCRRLQGTSAALARSGLLVLCLEASMASGHPSLASAIADALADGTLAPPGALLPERIVVGGHSAGAVFASWVGSRLAQRAPGRLAGALLLDPVATGDFEANLRAIAEGARRGVVAVSANSGPCNAQQNAKPALQRLARSIAGAGGDGFVGVQLTQGSTHVDAEGEDTSWAAVTACGQGAPVAANVDALRQLAAAWALRMARGGGVRPALGNDPVVESLMRDGRAVPIATREQPVP